MTRERYQELIDDCHEAIRRATCKQDARNLEAYSKRLESLRKIEGKVMGRKVEAA